jgi:hypothetical protein
MAAAGCLRRRNAQRRPPDAAQSRDAACRPPHDLPRHNTRRLDPSGAPDSHALDGCRGSRRVCCLDQVGAGGARLPGPSPMTTNRRHRFPPIAWTAPIVCAPGAGIHWAHARVGQETFPHTRAFEGSGLPPLRHGSGRRSLRGSRWVAPRLVMLHFQPGTRPACSIHLCISGPCASSRVVSLM